MTVRLGSSYIGSKQLETSTANHQVIPSKPQDWSHGYRMYKFSFIADQECTVTINEDTEIYLRAGQEFHTDESDAPIWSFVIKEPNITFNWVGAY